MVEGTDSIPENKSQSKGEMSEAEIDRNLQDTFPASDPPSWTLGTDHQEPLVKDEENKDKPSQN
jgi:hypothetical protein